MLDAARQDHKSISVDNPKSDVDPFTLRRCVTRLGEKDVRMARSLRRGDSRQTPPAAFAVEGP